MKSLKRTTRTKEQLIQDIADLEEAIHSLPPPTGKISEVMTSTPYKIATAIVDTKRQLFQQYGFRFPGDTYDYADLPGVDPK